MINRTQVIRFAARKASDFKMEIPPMPELGISAVTGNAEQRKAELDRFNGALKLWREQLSFMPSAFAARAQASSATADTSTSTSSDVPSYSSQDLAQNQSIAVLQSLVSKIISGPYHRFRSSDGALQLRNPNNGLYHTVLGFDSFTITMEMSGEP